MWGAAVRISRSGKSRASRAAASTRRAASTRTSAERVSSAPASPPACSAARFPVSDNPLVGFAVYRLC